MAPPPFNGKANVILGCCRTPPVGRPLSLVPAALFDMIVVSIEILEGPTIIKVPVRGLSACLLSLHSQVHEGHRQRDCLGTLTMLYQPGTVFCNCACLR